MTSIRNLCLCLFPMLSALLLSGCGNTSHTEVQGNVTLDGQPISLGTILFLPAEGNNGSAIGGEIRDGKYDIPLNRSFLAGHYNVRLNAPKNSKPAGTNPAKSTVPGMDSDWSSSSSDEAFPERFNTKTTLDRELKAGKNQVDFVLTTKE